MNKKIVQLLSLALLLTACGTSGKGNVSSANSSRGSVPEKEIGSDPVIITSIPNIPNIFGSSNVNSSPSTPNNSSNSVTTGQSSTSSVTSSVPQENTSKVTIPLLNPGFSNQFVNGDLSTLVSYINNIAKFDLVKANSEVSACQIMHVTDKDGDFDCLTIGTSKSAGKLKLNLNKTVTKVELKVQTYNKAYTNQGVDCLSLDSSSALYVNKDSNFIDLSFTSTDLTRPPVKEASFDINSTSLTLYNLTAPSRAFVRELTLTLGE